MEELFSDKQVLDNFEKSKKVQKNFQLDFYPVTLEIPS